MILPALAGRSGILLLTSVLAVLLIVGFTTLNGSEWPSQLFRTNRDHQAHSASRSRTIYNPGSDPSSNTAYYSGDGVPFAFRERHDIESLDPSYDHAWNEAMSTPLGGFLLVAHNESFHRAWGVSMFHSIHCLTMLRMSFQNYFGLSEGHGHMSSGGHGGHGQAKRGFVDLSKIDERQHVEHCLGYIGRALLCNGDDTLEPPIGEVDEQGNVIWSGVSGEGVQHTCRDSSHAWDIVSRSEDEPLQPFDWKAGDTMTSVFGNQ